MTKQNYSSIEQHEANHSLSGSPVLVAYPVSDEADLLQAKEEAIFWTEPRAAACFGAALGCCCLGGFIPALLCSTACLYCAKKEEQSCMRDMARASGSMVIQACSMARDLDDKYKVVDASKDAARTMWNEAQRLNEEHQIAARTSRCLRSTIQAGTNFVNEQRVEESATNGAANVASVVRDEECQPPVMNTGHFKPGSSSKH